MTPSQQADWVSQSVSWLSNDLEEIKRFAKIKGISLSSYIRSLTRRDRHRRLKVFGKFGANRAPAKLKARLDGPDCPEKRGCRAAH